MVFAIAVGQHGATRYIRQVLRKPVSVDVSEWVCAAVRDESQPAVRWSEDKATELGAEEPRLNVIAVVHSNMKADAEFTHVETLRKPSGRHGARRASDHPTALS
jgi:hypothetical protein